MPNPFEVINIQLTERITRLEKRLAQLEGVRQLYDIGNESSPAQLTGNQNDYNPGDYDVLRVSSDASRTITGVAGGVMGRRILWVNVGSNDIVFAHQSGSSTAANRIITYDGNDYTLAADELVSMYYDNSSSRWRLGQLV